MTATLNHWTILGAGAVGHLLACGFARKHIPVRLLYRNQQSFSQSKVVFRYRDSIESCKLTYFPVAKQSSIENLLLTVKSYQVEEAVLSIKEALTPSSQIFVLQNGMGTLEKVNLLLADKINQEHIFPGINTHGCYLSKKTDGMTEVIHAGSGGLIFGHNFLKTTHSKEPASFRDLKQLPLKAQWSIDILQQLWLKLAINAAINPVTAINQCKNGELNRSSALKHLVEQLCQETALLFKMLGIKISLHDILTNVHNVSEKTADNYSSMLQDIRTGNRTEIEAINGYLLTKADTIGFPMQIHQQLYQQILALKPPD